MSKKDLIVFTGKLEDISDGEQYCAMLSFYNKDGVYIGDEDRVKNIIGQLGISPEPLSPDSKVCSIGKSVKDGKWYGWSHRAICGFQVGNIVEDGDCCASSGWTEEYLKEHPDELVLPVGFEAKTDEDCKKMAIAFANSVG